MFLCSVKNTFQFSYFHSAKEVEESLRLLNNMEKYILFSCKQNASNIKMRYTTIFCYYDLLL